MHDDAGIRIFSLSQRTAMGICVAPSKSHIFSSLGWVFMMYVEGFEGNGCTSIDGEDGKALCTINSTA